MFCYGFNGAFAFKMKMCFRKEEKRLLCVRKGVFAEKEDEYKISLHGCRAEGPWWHLEMRDAALCSSPPSNIADLVFVFLIFIHGTPITPRGGQCSLVQLTVCVFSEEQCL